MEGYTIPVLYCIGIGVFLWLRKMDGRGRIVPYREALISKGSYPLRQASSANPPTFVWILRTFNETSRLYRMIQYFHSHYGFKQTVIIPNESKVSPQNEIPILEFFQVTEIAVAIQGATHIFSEAGVTETAATTAERAHKPLLLFIHDEESDKEFRDVLNIHRLLTPIYTSRWIQTLYGEITPKFIQTYLPVFMKEHQTHTTREKIACFCPNSRWKFQAIAAKLPAYEFLYSASNVATTTKSKFTEIGILCIMDSATTNYEVALKAAASGIPIVALKNPILEEILQGACIFVKSDNTKEWLQPLLRLKEDALFYRDQSQKSAKLAAAYDSPTEMDRLLNLVKS